MIRVVERESEICVLERSVRDVREGRGGMVVVEAGAGLGKTTLLRRTHDLARASGLDLLTARGADMERDFAFGAVRQLFEPAVRARGGDLEKLPTGAPQREPDRPAPGALYPILQAFYRLLADWSAVQPVVVAVDDAQWLDAPSLQFLGFLSRRLDSVRVLLVVTWRSADGYDDAALDDILAVADSATVLQPRALSPEAVAGLVREAFGSDADDGFCDACHAVTAGNPLFVKELLRVLEADGIRPDGAGALSVRAAGPGAVRRHVVTRLRRQPAHVRAVARAAAVLGDGTDPALVARLAGLAPAAVAEAAELLVGQGIFESAAPPAFVHAIVRDVVLGLIPAAERGAEHDRAARVLQDAGESAERVASHLLQTPAAGDADRVGVLLTAADQARRRGSPGGAAVYLLRARNEPPPPEQRSEISRLLGNCRAYRLEFDEAETHLSEALALADSPVQRALCAYSLARFRSACGDLDTAVDLLADAARRLSDEGGHALVDELEAELIGQLRTVFGGRRRLLEHLSAFRSRPGTSTAVVDAQLSIEAVLEGEPAAESAAIARRALTVTGERITPDRAAIWTALHVLITADHLDEADEHLHRMLDVALRRGLLFPLALARGYLARIAFLRGDLAKAREHVALGSEGLHSPHFALPVLQAAQVELLIEEGRLEQAEAVVQDGVLANGGAPGCGLHLWLLGARTRLRLEQGRFDAALLDATVCGEAYERWGAPNLLDVPWRLYAARALYHLGEHERAHIFVGEHLRLAEKFGAARPIAAALRTAGELAEPGEEAVRLSGEAIRMLHSCDARLESAKALEQLGGQLLELGRRPAGIEALAQAAEFAEQCDAKALADRLALTAAHAGDRRERRYDHGLHAFTASERKVAGLVADGLSNREIAARLFLSQKTVEAHLSRAYRKLGVNSRTQLALCMSTAVVG